jgi:hypothetical protein
MHAAPDFGARIAAAWLALGGAVLARQKTGPALAIAV